MFDPERGFTLKIPEIKETQRELLFQEIQDKAGIIVFTSVRHDSIDEYRKRINQNEKLKNRIYAGAPPCGGFSDCIECNLEKGWYNVIGEQKRREELLPKVIRKMGDKYYKFLDQQERFGAQEIIYGFPLEKVKLDKLVTNPEWKGQDAYLIILFAFLEKDFAGRPCALLEISLIVDKTLFDKIKTEIERDPDFINGFYNSLFPEIAQKQKLRKRDGKVITMFSDDFEKIDESKVELRNYQVK